MKYCPACLSQYSDPTLRFCLQDGKPLLSIEKQSSVDTVAFSRPVTAPNISPTSGRIDVRPEWSKDQEKHAGALGARPAKPKGSRKGMIMVILGIPIVLILAAGAVGGWLYFSQKKHNVPKDEAIAQPPVQSGPANTSPPVAIQETLSTQNSNAAADAEILKKEVTEVVNSWKQAMEARNMAAYAGKYAEKVDYFDNSGAAIADIRGEVQKTFDAFKEIEIDLSNLLVAVNAEGNSASAVFDKEWSYESDSKLTEGKAHTKLHLQKIGGEWKIVAEKYQKIYFIEN